MRTGPTTGLDEPQPAGRIAPLDAVLRVNAIARRAARAADLAAEDAIHRSLAAALELRPESVPQTVVDVAANWCGAPSAGISLLQRRPNGTSLFRWAVVSGRLAEFSNYCFPADFSTCRVCLDRDEPVLFAFPERRFTYLKSLEVAFVETLAVPITIDGRLSGTLWIAAHAIGRRFDMHDVRTLNQLGVLAGSAYARQIGP